MICLHGVSGSSNDPYMHDIAGSCAENGIHSVLFNHYAPKGQNDLRLMDLSQNEHLDEVIEYTHNRFKKEGRDCDIYLSGFSLGGNHVLRYMGKACKQKSHTECNDHSHFVKGIIAISMPFDCTICTTKLKQTYMGLFDKIIAYS